MKKDNIQNISQLGDQNARYVYDTPDKNVLETFANQFSYRDYVVEYIFREFSSLCPKTGQPDFATIKVQYTPDKKCIETKSLKLYFLRYRQHGAFMETIANNIIEDCIAIASPRWIRITANFNPRGGTDINVSVEHKKSDNLR